MRRAPSLLPRRAAHACRSHTAACEDGDPSLVAAASLRIAGGHGQFISNVHLEPYRDEAHFHGELYPRYHEGLLGQAEEFCRLTKCEGGDDAEKTLAIVSAGALVLSPQAAAPS